MQYYRQNPVNKSEIAAITGRTVNQTGGKQLFTAYFNTFDLLFSYYTIVGYRKKGQPWTCTNQKFSITTSKQISSLAHTKQDESNFKQTVTLLLESEAKEYLRKHL